MKKKTTTRKKATKKKAPTKKCAPRRPKAPPGWKYGELGELVRDQAARKKEIKFQIAEAVADAKFPLDAELAIIRALSEQVAEDIDREILGELMNDLGKTKAEKDFRPEFESIKAALLTLGAWLNKDTRRTIVLSSRSGEDRKCGDDSSFHVHAKVEDTEYDSEDAKDLRHAIELLAEELRLG